MNNSYYNEFTVMKEIIEYKRKKVIEELNKIEPNDNYENQRKRIQLNSDIITLNQIKYKLDEIKQLLCETFYNY